MKRRQRSSQIQYSLAIACLCSPLLLTSSPLLAQQPPRGTNRSVLRLGSRGAEVSNVQAALKLLGYYTGPVDGVYSESTIIAVFLFQQAANLNANGIVDAATWNALFPSAPPVVRSQPSAQPSPPAATARPRSPSMPTLRVGMSGPAVRTLQERLRTLGFPVGAVDGVFGEQTLTAVIALQQRFNLNPDGVVGPATWNVLLRR